LVEVCSFGTFEKKEINCLIFRVACIVFIWSFSIYYKFSIAYFLFAVFSLPLVLYWSLYHFYEVVIFCIILHYIFWYLEDMFMLLFDI